MSNGKLSKDEFEARHHWRVRWSRLKLRWPFLVWMGACLAAFWLYSKNPASFQEAGVRGVVDAETVSLASVEVARIQKIKVVPGQHVARGEVMVEMDTAMIARDVTADLLDAITIDTAFGDTHQDLLQAVSQRLDAIADIETELALCKQDFEREKAELDALEAEQERRNKLFRDHIIDEITCNELQPALHALERAVRLYPARVATFEKQLQTAQTSYRHIATWLDYHDGESLSTAIGRHLDEDRVATVIEKVKTEATLRSDAYVLRAPKDGIVADVLRQEGDVVGPELPIVRLVAPSPSRIKAYLDESQMLDMRIGQRVIVSSMHRKMKVPITATVLSLATDVNAAAYVMSANGKPLPLRARRAVLSIDGPHDLLGGESIFLRLPPKLRFDPTGWLPERWRPFFTRVEGPTP